MSKVQVEDILGTKWVIDLESITEMKYTLDSLNSLSIKFKNQVIFVNPVLFKTVLTLLIEPKETM